MCVCVCGSWKHELPVSIATASSSSFVGLSHFLSCYVFILFFFFLHFIIHFFLTDIRLSSLVFCIMYLIKVCPWVTHTHTCTQVCKWLHKHTHTVFTFMFAWFVSLMTTTRDICFTHIITHISHLTTLWHCDLSVCILSFHVCINLHSEYEHMCDRVTLDCTWACFKCSPSRTWSSEI